MKRIGEAREARRRMYDAAVRARRASLHSNDSVVANATSTGGRLDSIPWGEVNTASSPAASDLAWVQCQPCDQCYAQSFPIFDPKQSPGFVMTNNQDSYCNSVQAIETIGRGADDSLCDYQTGYADGTSTFGYIAKDQFNFWDAGAGSDGVTVSVPGMGFGCGTKNTYGVQTVVSGVLGMGFGRALSMGEQFLALNGVSPAFAFCFAPIFSDPNSGWLMFGDGALPPSDYPSTPLLQDEGFSVYFYVELVDFVIGDQRVGVPADVFDIDSDDQTGGVIVDVGDIVSIITTDAYAPFRAAWINAVIDILGEPGVPGPDGLDTCWDYPNVVGLPSIGFLFSNGNVLRLSPEATQLIFIDDNNVRRMCWPFLQKSEESSTFASMVIGAVSLHSTEVIFDTENNIFAWNPRQC
ncbi:hypothetical protein GOP47_0019982 [Adiantum capillus-veneris]|uniref:Peptidase A1 domain-containing protein n=1 Tax=Adiantum capillus-veneris TaxID=13818 RepID=A0A9D4Z944_ADICA|nr:hypothetical protein GOP47_0019982 [Adiantum capillus-veneris]